MLISNTSTLVLLAKVTCLEIFLESAQVAIPEQVREEALFENEAYYARLISKMIDERKILIKGAKNELIKEVMVSFRLDAGEAAAYALFDGSKHKAILTDDGELIKLCRLEKITFICAMAIVVKLFESKKLSKPDALEKLRKLREEGRYSEKIYEHFKSEVK